jgi:hypothetical protein
MVELRGEVGDPRPFTAVKAGAMDSAAFSFSMYGDCVLRIGNWRTADILLDNGLDECLRGSFLLHLSLCKCCQSATQPDRTSFRSSSRSNLHSLQMVHAALSDVSLGWMFRLLSSRENGVCRDAVEGGASIVARQADMVFTFRSTALKAAFALMGVDIYGTDCSCNGQMA